MASSSVKACCDMIHDISLGDERKRELKFIDLFVFKSQGSNVEHGQKDKHARQKDKQAGQKDMDKKTSRLP